MTEYRILIGKEAADQIDFVSAMRIKHFREYPYLYDATLDPEYEKKYIHELAQNPHAMVVLAYANSKPIAISTSLPLASDADILHGLEPEFKRQGYNNLSEFYYWSEAIIEPEFRGYPILPRLYERFEFQVLN
ncbi:MAG: hypothetical protein HY308_00560 [Gammaproteobacteria bacterium]|nr:hypothetical protein [Gammaproteobacteria bacterium]